jgi:hypothetical protein
MSSGFYNNLNPKPRSKLVGANTSNPQEWILLLETNMHLIHIMHSEFNHGSTSSLNQSQFSKKIFHKLKGQVKEHIPLMLLILKPDFIALKESKSVGSLFVILSSIRVALIKRLRKQFFFLSLSLSPSRTSP